MIIVIHSPSINVVCCFVFVQLESLNQSELASRLTLNCQNSYVEPHKIKDVAVTIIDVRFTLRFRFTFV